MEGEYVFLSPEWVHEAIRTVQGARSADKEFGKLTRDFSLAVAYIIMQLPQRLKDIHGASQLAILIQLDRGAVKKLWLGTEVPPDKRDFTITTDYNSAKQLFRGEANPATAFIDRKIKVEPLRRAYQRPKFTSKVIVAANALLKFARQVPTAYPQ